MAAPPAGEAAPSGGAAMRTADIIAARLREAGVRHAFGIPGGEVLTLIDGLERAGIRFHLARHENAAGFMAEGVYHMTGRPGVLVCTVGPGAANAVNVTANALQDRVPLIVLTGCIDPADAVSYNHQVFDHGAVFRPIVKASFTVPDGAVDAMIDKALAIAMDDRPGPVHLDLPIAVAERMQPPAAPVRRARPAPAAPAEGPELDRARRWLAAAERPLIVAGLDVLNHGAAAGLAAFARRHQAPVIASYKAKGVLADDDPLSLGGAGLSPLADRHLHPVVGAADLIILAGYDPIEMRVGWRNVWDPSRQRVVEFAAAPNDHYMHHAGIGFVCDIGAGLAALDRGVNASDRRWPGGEAAAAKRALATAFGQTEDWGPAAVADTVRQAAPRDAVITCDSGAHRILISQVWPTYLPRTVLQSTGLCTMGCAVPLAAGARLAAPGRPVIAFTGDGGLEMVLGELATLRDLRLPVLVVVLVDASLALIEMKQRASGFANAGVDGGESDFASVARALGGHGVVCEDRDGLAAAARAALAADRFTVIACRIPRQAYDGRI